MTEPAAPQQYDFRRPRTLADDVDRELNGWQVSFAGLISDRWEQQLGVALKWQVELPSNVKRSQAIERIGGEHVCFEFRVDNGPCILWMAVPRRFLLALMAMMFGEIIEELPEDRSLSDVESAVVELAIQEVGRVLTDSQTVRPPLMIEYSGSRRIQEMTRVFSEQDPVAIGAFTVQSAAGDSQCLWLIPQPTLLAWMTHLGEAKQAAIDSQNEIDQLVRQIPMELIVRLGRADLPVSDLMALQPGDIIVLDQRVTDPLVADVGETTLFRGWPGRVGSRQGFQIDTVEWESGGRRAG